MMFFDCDIHDVFTALEANEQGLTTLHAATRLKKYGPNKLPDEKTVTLLEIFLRQLQNPLVYILAAAGGISIIAQKSSDAIFIFIVIVINTVLGCYQEWRAEQSSQALKKLIEIKARVIRDSKEVSLLASELVPGDIVLLEAGIRVPADLRIIEATNLYANESMLTGESVSIHKKVCVVKSNAEISEQINMLFAGTTLEKGSGKGIVVHTGVSTQIGKIAQSVTSTPEQKSPLTIKLDRFVQKITVMIIGLCLILFALGLAQGRNLTEIFFTSVALLVSAIPEGLPIAVTIGLARAAHKMAQNKVIIRRLAAVEGMGSCDLIASDKTGTLTVNKQTITLIVLGDMSRYTVSGVGYNNDGTITAADGDHGAPSGTLYDLATIGCLSNDAYLKQEDNQWIFHGDNVDLAFLALGLKIGITRDQIKTYDIFQQIPFNEDNRFSACEYLKDEAKVIGIKGAAETIIPLCSWIKVNNQKTTINHQLLFDEINTVAAAGYRVLVIAQKESTGQELGDAIKSANFEFIGFVGMIDPLREEARDSIQHAISAGVKTIIITGDHPQTALTIGKQLGIANYHSDLITGQELEGLLAEDSKKIISKKIDTATIFARVTPLQKYDIVKYFKDKNFFVAVTGDGVNDAPALKLAHLGIAMGSGTDIAKDSAAAIITDDNFASIVRGIREGRTAYANIRKVIFLLISAGFAELFFVIASVALNLPIPLTAIQILWLNLVTNGIQDVALSFEEEESFFMKTPLKIWGAKIFNSHMIQQVLLTGGSMGIIMITSWGILINQGLDESTARNILFLFFIVMQNYHALNCTSEYNTIFSRRIFHNKIMLGAIITAHLAHIICMHTAPLQQLLDVKPISFEQWGLTLMLASSIIFISEIFKYIKRKKITL